MKRHFLDIYNIWLSEIKVVFRDPAAILLMVLVPLFYPLLYAFIYDNEVVRDVKVVIVDESNSSLSREFRRKMDAAPDVKVVAQAANMEEGKEFLKRKDAYGIVVIPKSFSRDLNSSKQTTVQVYADMSSMLYYKAILMAATEVSLDIGADIRVADIGFGTKEEDEAKMQAVDYEWVPFFNVPNGFASFLVPAILILVIQQTLLLGVGTLVGTHNDRKTFTIASHVHIGKNVNAFKLTLGKAFAYSMIYLISSAWILRVVPYIFNLPQIGDPLTLAAFIFPYVLAVSFFAMTLSYFSSQREFVMLLFVFTSVPLLFLSGISWPWVSVPPMLKAVAYIFPSTAGIHGFVKINTMGAALSDAWFEYIMLWVQVLFYWITSTAMYSWWIRNYDPIYKGRIPTKG